MLKAGLSLLIRYWIPLLAYGVLILFLSSRPASQLPRFNLPDKLLHTIEYAFLGALLLRLFWRDYGWQGIRLVSMIIFVLALFGAMDETLQSFVPGRDADALDWIADLCGGTLGAIGYWLVRKTWEKLQA